MVSVYCLKYKNKLGNSGLGWSHTCFSDKHFVGVSSGDLG